MFIPDETSDIMVKTDRINSEIMEQFSLNYVLIRIAQITLGGRRMDEVKSTAGTAVLGPLKKKRKN